MREEILEYGLRPEHKKVGLYLEEPDDHTVCLMKDGKVLAVFTQYVTITELWKEADKFLEKLT